MGLLNSVLFVCLLVISAASVMGSRVRQNASGGQQGQPTSPQRQIISTSSLETVTGCVVQNDHGYTLRTENETYPIVTDIDLSQLVDMQIRVTGALERYTAAAPSAAGTNLAAVTSLHIRKIGWVIGNCGEPSK